MNREIKFRAWYKPDKEMIYYNNWADIRYLARFAQYDNVDFITQYTGLKDKNGKEIYEGDVCRFDNGDTIIIKMEDWLEVCIVPIGDIKCEDQWRDLYRISNSEIIGNIYENPELNDII
jgi:uncharacterized phage protein (TIGR01671 family)